MKYATYTADGQLLSTGYNPFKADVERVQKPGVMVAHGIDPDVSLETHEVEIVKGKPVFKKMTAAKIAAKRDRMFPKSNRVAEKTVTVNQVIRALAKKGIVLTENDFK